jgi:nucleoside-diphosphate-sugar epimerase
VRAVARRRPLIPIIGDGMRLLQPIWVEDVVSCFVGALDDSSTAGRAYELGGPESYGFEQLVDLVAEAEEIHTLKVHLPVWLMRPVVGVMGRASSSFPITPDQLKMLLEDSVCDIAEMRDTFGIEPASIRDHLAD